MNENKKVISLFSGAMGLDIGLEKAGFTVILGQEFDKDCLTTAKLNRRNILPGDIRNISAEEILTKADLIKGEAFLVCGGPPCQPFSMAGRRMGIQDPRGSLFKDFVRMVDGIRPRFFLMENVSGLSYLKIDKKTSVLDIVLAEFKKIKYSVVWGIVSATDYGVPQLRKRLFILGSRDNEPICLPETTHDIAGSNGEPLWRTLGDAIRDIEDNPGDYMKLPESRMRFLRLVPEGGNWRNLPVSLQEEAMGGAYRSGGGRTGFYRRLSYQKPSPTLTVSPGQKATMMCHPTKDRVLSVKEYARIQQFPDEWQFAGTISAQYRQIGNAVPVGLAEQIGKAILATAEGTAMIKTKRVK